MLCRKLRIYQTIYLVYYPLHYKCEIQIEFITLEADTAITYGQEKDQHQYRKYIAKKVKHKHITTYKTRTRQTVQNTMKQTGTNS